MKNCTKCISKIQIYQVSFPSCLTVIPVLPRGLLKLWKHLELSRMMESHSQLIPGIAMEINHSFKHSHLSAPCSEPFLTMPRTNQSSQQDLRVTEAFLNIVVLLLICDLSVFKRWSQQITEGEIVHRMPSLTDKFHCECLWGRGNAGWHRGMGMG